MVWWGLSTFICSIYLSLVYSRLKTEKVPYTIKLYLQRYNASSSQLPTRKSFIYENYIYYRETGTKIIIKALLYFQELTSGPYRNQSGNCYCELIDRFLSNPQEYENHETQWIYQ